MNLLTRRNDCTAGQMKSGKRKRTLRYYTWAQFTENTESAFAETNIHTDNIMFTNIILMADKHNIPKGKMHSNCMLLPDHIVCKITQSNNIRRANTCDPALKLLNEEITSDIQKQNLWKEHLDALWKTIHSLSNIALQLTLYTSITFNNKITTTPKHNANCFIKQFRNPVKHATHKAIKIIMSNIQTSSMHYTYKPRKYKITMSICK